MVEEFAFPELPAGECVLCKGPEGDRLLRRVQVWEDAHWRLTTSLYSEVLGFSYLEPKRHIPHVTDLDGDEARTLGLVLARTSRALKEVTGAPLVYVLVFGGRVPHLHLHLAPNLPADVFNLEFVKPGSPLLPEERLRAAADRLRGILAARA